MELFVDYLIVGRKERIVLFFQVGKCVKLYIDMVNAALLYVHSIRSRGYKLLLM